MIKANLEQQPEKLNEDVILPPNPPKEPIPPTKPPEKPKEPLHG